MVQLHTIPPAAMARCMTQPEAKPWINAIHAYTPGKAKSDDGRVLIKLNEYKRRQAPVGIRVTHRSFGKDWRYPITNHFRA